jgi:hypothetical protein
MTPDDWESKNSSPSITVADVVQISEYRSSNSLTNWKKKAEIKLRLIESGCCEEFESKITNPIIFDHSQALISELPLIIDAPFIGVNDDGTILFEWHKIENGKNTIFSVILNGETIIHSMMNAGQNPNYGAMSFSEDAIDFISNLLLKYFEVSLYDKRITKK